MNRGVDVFVKSVFNRYKKRFFASLCCGVALTSLDAQAELKLLGFGDVTFYNANATTTPKGGTAVKTDYNTFSVGALDILWTSKIGEKGSFFAETAIEEGVDNQPGIDIERLFFKYALGDYLAISVGRVHTALGYWNDAYHHGGWFQVPVTRPIIYLFEDGGGLLPTHSVGVEFRGSLLNNKLGYIGNIANGRGITPDPPTNVYAANKMKSANLLLYYNLPVEGLRIGGLFLRDVIPASTARSLDSTTLNPDMKSFGDSIVSNVPKGTESIIGAHLVYQAHNSEVLAEYHGITHKYSTGDIKSVKANSVYLQVSHQFHDLYTPYLRYENIKGDSKNQDPYLGDRLPQGLNTQVNTIGFRYELNDSAALKGEYAMFDRKTSNGEVKRNYFRTNVSFHF